MNDFDGSQMVQVEQALQKGNFAVAYELLIPLAEAGNHKAQCYLASAYQLGLGTEVDGEKALALYKKVAEQDIQEEGLSALAYNNMATIYFVGVSGIERDPEQGAKCLEKARNLGFPV